MRGLGPNSESLLVGESAPLPFRHVNVIGKVRVIDGRFPSLCVMAAIRRFTGGEHDLIIAARRGRRLGRTD